MDAINVDDTDPSIVYSGSWQVFTNNPLEFGGGVHSTTQSGASATITFNGTRLQMFCTVAMGTGNETVDFTFDGRTGPSLTRSSHPDISYYKDGWFDSGPVPNAVHILTVSNGGGPSDTPFQVDYLTVNGSMVLPSGTAASSGSPSASSTGRASSTANNANTSHPSGSKTPVGAIVGGVVGGVVGGLFLVAFLILLIFLHRRRKGARITSTDNIQEREETPRPRTMTSITPFELDPRRTPTSPSGDSTTNLATNNSNSSTEKNPHLFSVSSPPQHPSFASSPPPSAPPDTGTDALSCRPHYLSDTPPSYQA